MKAKKPVDITLTKPYQATKKSMLQELKENGVTGQHHVSLVDTYMRCWADVKQLEDDIKTRGITVSYLNRAGGEELKKNESLGEKVRVIAQMLRIRESLGLRLKENSEVKQPEGDDEDC